MNTASIATVIVILLLFAILLVIYFVVKSEIVKSIILLLLIVLSLVTISIATYYITKAYFGSSGDQSVARYRSLLVIVLWIYLFAAIFIVACIIGIAVFLFFFGAELFVAAAEASAGNASEYIKLFNFLLLGVFVVLVFYSLVVSVICFYCAIEFQTSESEVPYYNDLYFSGSLLLVVFVTSLVALGIKLFFLFRKKQKPDELQNA